MNYKIIIGFLIYLFSMQSTIACRTSQLENPVYPLKVSANGRYFVDQDNQPFLYQACTAWKLLSRLTKEETEIYLDNRKELGFNTVQVTLLPWEVELANAYGEYPFINQEYFTNPNPKYFDHVEWVLNQAGERGIQLLINPFWLRNNWREYITPEKGKTYGTFLANRFKEIDNLMWFHGGDINPGSKMESVVAMAETMDKIDEQHLTTYHGGRYKDGTSTSSSTFFHSEDWLDFNMSYCYDPFHGARLDPYGPVQFRSEYQMVPVKPFILGESFYEELDESMAKIERKKIRYGFESDTAYYQALRRTPLWLLTYGGAGHAIGNHKIWAIIDGWQDALDDPLSQTVNHLQQLFSGLTWHNLVPDFDHKVLTAGFGNFGGAAFVTNAYDPNGTLMLAYFPVNGTITVDLSFFKNDIIAEWFDPTNGKIIPESNKPIQNKHTREFRNNRKNGQGAEDFILILRTQ
jgi:hypothetical protein